MGNENSNGFNICQNTASLSPKGVFQTTSKRFFAKLTKQDDWKSRLSSLRSKVETSLKSGALFGPQIWNFIFSTVQNYYLNTNEKFEFIQILSKLLKTNFGETKMQPQLIYCGQVGQKIQSFQNRLYFKHKHCLQYCKFESTVSENENRFYYKQFPQLQFSMDFQEAKTVASIVRSFCKNDMDSFAFLGLYLAHSLNWILKQSGAKINLVEERLVQILYKLEQIYPANQNTYGYYKKEEVEIKQIKNGSYEKLNFIENGKTHLDQLKQFVIKKAQQAKKDEQAFIQLVKSICLQKGYGFKHGTKIKNKDHNSAIMRTIQKLLSKQKYQKFFQENKASCLKEQESIEKKHSNRLKNFFQWQKTLVQAKIKQILQKETNIQFDSKDLLRGKCIFSNKNDIVQAVKQIQRKILQKNYTLFQLKNRLNKNTEDVTLVIKLPNSVAELQLALKLNTVCNQFNHKIYELKRSNMYTSISNLCLLNQQWCLAFFTEQQNMAQFGAKNCQDKDFDEKQNFSSIVKRIKNFDSNYLKTDFLDIQISKDDTKQIKKIQQSLDSLEQLISKGYVDVEIQKRQLERHSNEINFYFKAKQYQKAVQIFQKMKPQQNKDQHVLYTIGQVKTKIGQDNQACQHFQQCLEIRQQKYGIQSIQYANTLQYLGISYINLSRYDEALNNLEKALKIYKKHNPDLQSQQFIYCYNNIGLAYFNQGNYEKAFEYYEKSLKLSQNLNGKQSQEVILSLTNIGVLYRNKGDYQKSIQYCEKCLKINQKINGKQSSQYADVLNNLGLVYECQNNFSKAFQCYSKHLEIKEKIFGKDSIQCGTVINNIGLAYLNMRKPADALKYFERSLHIFQKTKNVDSSDCALAYVNIGQANRELNNNEKALEYYQKALKIYQKVQGQESIVCAPPLMNIGLIYDSQNKLQKAQEYYLKALSIQIKVKGQKCLDVTTTYINLALLAQRMNNLQKSLDYATKSYQIRKKILGSNHAKTKNAWNQVNFITIKLKK